MIKIVFAVGSNNEFGNKGALPWPHCSEDLVEFRKETRDSALVMGVGTFESLPRLLPGRTHAVISTRIGFDSVKTRSNERPDIIAFGDVENLVAELTDCYAIVCVIGGPKLIAQALHLADEVVMTQFNGSYDHDIVMDQKVIDSIRELELVEISNFETFTKYRYRKCPTTTIKKA